MSNIQYSVPHSWNEILKIRRRSFSCSKRKMNIGLKPIHTLFYCDWILFQSNEYLIQVFVNRHCYSHQSVNTPLYSWTTTSMVFRVNITCLWSYLLLYTVFLFTFDLMISYQNYVLTLWHKTRLAHCWNKNP